MSRRIRPTHHATVSRYGQLTCGGNGDCPGDAVCEDGVCVDELGNPIEGRDEVAEGIPVRYDPEHELVRDEAGDVVRRTPGITAPGQYATVLEEGDDISLEPISDGGGTYDDLEIRSVEPVLGRRSRPVKTEVALER